MGGRWLEKESRLGELCPEVGFHHQHQLPAGPLVARRIPCCLVASKTPKYLVASRNPVEINCDNSFSFILELVEFGKMRCRWKMPVWALTRWEYIFRLEL